MANVPTQTDMDTTISVISLRSTSIGTIMHFVYFPPSGPAPSSPFSTGDCERTSKS